MLFNSFDFAVFLAVSWPIYRAVQSRRMPRLLWLLAISAFFYGCWKPWYLTLIAASTLIQYVVGARIHAAATDTGRTRWLITGILSDVALLGTFKYGNFIVENVDALLHLLQLSPDVSLPRLPTELPVGISFYTFQTLSYIIDIHRKRIQPRKSLLDFSVYVFFFPQLVAGPIVRAADFLPQLDKRPRLDWKAIGEGTFLILAGLTKKMVLADSLHHFVVEPFFRHPSAHNTVKVLYAVWAANFQVYCDFSGYTDVATGAALLFGFTLPLNFNRPFWSQTPMEHWRRWHISLSTWLKDYLYIPLGGSRKGPWRTDLNLVITFFIGGIWHGAGWTFVFWGLYNGVLLVVWRRWGPRDAKTRFGVAWRTFLTFNAICLGLIFLHAPTFSDALTVLSGLFDPLGPSAGVIDRWGLLALVAAMALHFTPQAWKRSLQTLFAGLPTWTLALIVLGVGGVLSLFTGLAAPFFYFQF